MNHIKTFESIISRYKNPDRIFMRAVEDNNIKKVVAFLKDDFNPNKFISPSFSGRLSTPLWEAVHNDNAEIVNELICYGADVNLIPPHHCPIIFLAISKSLDVLKLILDYANWDVLNKNSPSSNNKMYFLELLLPDRLEWLKKNYQQEYEDFLQRREMEKYNL